MQQRPSPDALNSLTAAPTASVAASTAAAAAAATAITSVAGAAAAAPALAASSLGPPVVGAAERRDGHDGDRGHKDEEQSSDGAGRVPRGSGGGEASRQGEIQRPHHF